jgi:hypothetical protein
MMEGIDGENDLGENKFEFCEFGGVVDTSEDGLNP